MQTEFKTFTNGEHEMAGKPKRAVVLSILDLMEAEYTAKITLARATKKLQRHVDKKGVPEGMNEEQTEVMGWLGLVEKEETTEETAKPKKPAKAKKETKAKTAPPKDEEQDEDEEDEEDDTEEEAPAKKEPKKEPKKETKPKGPRLNWMRVATQAILDSKDMKAAAAKAVDIYREKGGTMTPKSDEWGRLYTGYAEKVLQECGHISLDKDGSITVL